MHRPIPGGQNNTSRVKQCAADGTIHSADIAEYIWGHSQPFKRSVMLVLPRVQNTCSFSFVVILTLANTRIGLVGLCWDRKSSYLQGPALAPPIIVNTLNDGSSNDYAENGVQVMNHIHLVGHHSFDQYHDIRPYIQQVSKEYDKLLILGGDHSITYPIVAALHENHQPFDILHIDAHTDLYDEFEGDKYSHACPFSRIMESKLCVNLYQVGIRGLTPHQKEQIDKFQVRCIEMRSLHELDSLQFNRPIYLSIDLDGFDPAYAPGVSHQEAGGLEPRMIINFLQGLNQEIIGADIVEYNPHRDHANITASLASKLVKEVASIMV